MDRRHFLKLAAATPILAALKPWARAIPAIVTPCELGPIFKGNQTGVYRYVRFETSVKIGDLVFWPDHTLAGVSHANSKARHYGWVLVSSHIPVRVPCAYGVSGG